MKLSDLHDDPKKLGHQDRIKEFEIDIDALVKAVRREVDPALFKVERRGAEHIYITSLDKDANFIMVWITDDPVHFMITTFVGDKRDYGKNLHVFKKTDLMPSILKAVKELQQRE